MTFIFLRHARKEYLAEKTVLAEDEHKFTDAKEYSAPPDRITRRVLRLALRAALKRDQNRSLRFCRTKFLIHGIQQIQKNQHEAGSFVSGAPDRIRTYDLCLRRATLYPAELRVLSV